MSAKPDATYTLILTHEERGVLFSLLEQSVTDVHAESRRTESPAYQEKVHHQEAVLRALKEKVGQLGG
jgi:hypothetical protein